MTQPSTPSSAKSVWLVGGFDPSGGAGVLRDFSTARAFAPSLPTHTMITTVTAQGDGLPARGAAVSVSELRAQFERAPQPAAIKVGLVPDDLAGLLAELLPPAPVPVVFDPVLSATAGGCLGVTAEGLMPLLRRATVLTPNLPELSTLRGPSQKADAAALRETLGIPAVLIKGGHAPAVDTEVVDVLHLATQTHVYRRSRCAGPSPRGTGCALATAIACGLAQELSVASACAQAIAWLDEARTRAVSVGPQVLLP